MTDYQPTEQDRVLLDYAQARHDLGPIEANKLFEFWDSADKTWCSIRGTHFCAAMKMRRKPRTVTLSYMGKEWELPVPNYRGNPHREVDICQTDEDDEKWSAALREIAGGENGGQ